MNANLLTDAPISFPVLIFNLSLGLILSTLTSWYYVKYAETLTNRGRLAQLLPVLTLIIILIISVVKSSLALSLGLVGALSIVRFRTAIKDPEELIYLFLAIAVGLGLGADQRIPTVSATLFIFLYLILRSRFSKRRGSNNNLFLSLRLPQANGGEIVFSQVNDTLFSFSPEVTLHRLDSEANLTNLVYLVKLSDQNQISAMMDTLRSKFPNGSISLIEQQG